MVGAREKTMKSPQHFPADIVCLMLAALFGFLSALAQPAEAQEGKTDTERLAQNGWMELHWAVAPMTARLPSS